MIFMKQLYFLLVILTLCGTLYANNLGLDATCSNITINATVALNNNGSSVNLNGTCQKTQSDASGDIIVYGSAADLYANCGNIAAVDNGNGKTTLTLLFQFFGANASQTFNEEAQTLEVSCEVTLNTNATAANTYQASSRTIGYASATAYSSSLFDSRISMIAPKTNYNVGDFIKINISMTADAFLSLKITPQTCTAMSAASGGTNYVLIDSRCPVDPTSSITRANDLVTELQFEAFYFKNAGNSVYIECQILVCLSASGDATCADCGGGGRRRRRSIDDNVQYIRSPIFQVLPKAKPMKKLKRDQYLMREGKKNLRNNCDEDKLERINYIVIIILLTSLILLTLFGCIKKLRDNKKFRNQQQQYAEDMTPIIEDDIDIVYKDTKSIIP